MFDTTGIIVFLCLLILGISLVNLIRSAVARSEVEGQLSTLASQNTELRALLEFDELTQAKSRQFLTHRVDQAQRSGPVTLLYIDMDRFKSVNEGHGNYVGDALLVAVAERIGECLGPGDFVARLSGDEFCAVLQGNDPKKTQALGRFIVAQIAAVSVKSGEHHVSRSASVGLCVLQPSQKLIDGLVTADGAIRRAKALGGNRMQLADRSVLKRLAAERARPSIEQLRSGLEKGEVIYHVQPIFNLRSNMVAGVEALIRWRTPSGAILQPEDFLDTMTGNYHISLKPPVEAANLAAQQITSLHPQMFCAFNISASFLERSRAVNSAWIDTLLNGVPAHQMVFEIVESAVIADPKRAHRVIGALREAGVRVALDDFGTGQSNLSRLREYPVDIVKIDRRFIHSLDQDYRNMGIVMGLVEMSNTMNFDIVAEGIETEAQLDAIRDTGIELAQGFLLGRPDEVSVWRGRLKDQPNMRLPERGVLA